MKDIIKQMDKAFDSRVRLGIMAILMANEWTDFNTLKERLGVTDGNLGSHTASLERKSFIKNTVILFGIQYGNLDNCTFENIQ